MFGVEVLNHIQGSIRDPYQKDFVVVCLADWGPLCLETPMYIFKG